MNDYYGIESPVRPLRARSRLLFVNRNGLNIRNIPEISAPQNASTEEDMHSSESENEDLEEIIDETQNLNLSEQGCQPRKYERKEIYCPFTWEECYKKFDGFDWISHLNSKLSTKNPNDWRTYCYKTLLGCIYVHQKEEEEATKIFDSCQNLLEEMISENFFKEIMEGLQHVLSSCRLYMNIKMSKNEAAREIFSSVKSFHLLDDMCKAAVFAVKAYILAHFGYEAQLEALKSAKAAVELDPDNNGIRKGAWYYLTGKILYELRHARSYGEMPSHEEKQLVERSVKIDPFPVHFILLADIYRETVKALNQKSFKDNRSKCEELAEEAKKIYEKAINDENATMNVLSRSGTGLIKLPKDFRNLELAEKAFERALIIDPANERALRGMGNLLEWHKDDQKQALKYFELLYAIDCHSAGLNVIKLKYKLNKDYDPLEDCNTYIKNLQNTMNCKEKLDLEVAFLMVKTEFLLVIRRNLMLAANELKKAIDIYPRAKNIREYKCIFVNDKEISLRNRMVKEITEAVAGKRFNNTDEKYLKDILDII